MLRNRHHILVLALAEGVLLGPDPSLAGGRVCPVDLRMVGTLCDIDCDGLFRNTFPNKSLTDIFAVDAEGLEALMSVQHPHSVVTSVKLTILRSGLGRRRRSRCGWGSSG